MNRVVTFRIYWLLAALEGGIAFALLIAEPSMDRNALLLGYSAPRIAIIALTLIALFVGVGLSLKSLLSETWLLDIGRWMDRQAYTRGRLLGASIVFSFYILVSVGSLIVFLPSNLGRFIPYPALVAIDRINPLLIWTMLLSIQSLALLIVFFPDRYRREILRDPRSYVVPAVASLIALAVLVRFFAFGDIQLSIANSDTQKFIKSSQIPLLTWDFLTSNRPPTIALFYKILAPRSGYEIVRVSEHAISGTTELVLNPGLHRVAIAQAAISMLSWLALAVVVARHLIIPLLKILGVLVITLFALSPQLSDWDRVLLSESLSFSLFALLLALTIEMSIRIARSTHPLSLQTRILGGLWLLVLVFWVFTRDSNAYLLPITLVMLVLPMVLPKLRLQIPTRSLTLLILILGILFAIHNATLNQSDRWVNPLLNNLIRNVLPDESRVAFFESRGMPVTDGILALQTSRGNELGFYEFPDFIEWVYQHGPSTYTLFLLSQPGWTLSTFAGNVDYLFSENTQPYFHTPSSSGLLWISAIGDILHPMAGSTLLVAVLLTLAYLTTAVSQRDPKSLALSWTFVWMLLTALALFFVSFHGDALAWIRHTLVAVLPLRLSLWLLSIFLADQLITLVRRRLMSMRRMSEAGSAPD
jgi:hypothetical protein